ncbi:MAG: class I SAM-dependent methyltransferase [Solirubrobacteraceae bacterium]
MSSQTPEQQQLDYYRETADQYAVAEYAEHVEALAHVVAFLRALSAGSVLDTGCGAGFAMRKLAVAIPELTIRGNDPSADLLRVAHERYGIDPDLLDCARSESLPYRDGEFDAVVETGILHHVPEPAKVVAEMVRVARIAVFISDENCYGIGSPSKRLIKLALGRSGRLGTGLRLLRGGHEWYSSPGDAVAWTYSVFDSCTQLRQSCPTVIVIPTGQQRLREACPVLCASHCLVVAIKAPFAELVFRSGAPADALMTPESTDSRAHHA